MVKLRHSHLSKRYDHKRYQEYQKTRNQFGEKVLSPRPSSDYNNPAIRTDIKSIEVKPFIKLGDSCTIRDSIYTQIQSIEDVLSEHSICYEDLKVEHKQYDTSYEQYYDNLSQLMNEYLGEYYCYYGQETRSVNIGLYSSDEEVLNELEVELNEHKMTGLANLNPASVNRIPDPTSDLLSAEYVVYFRLRWSDEKHGNVKIPESLFKKRNGHDKNIMFSKKYDLIWVKDKV